MQRSDHAIRFTFADSSDASMAYATLHELGYEPVRDGHRVQIRLERGDLTSALEIAMAYGGELALGTAIPDDQLIGSAYGLATIPIPAHVVNEDLDDAYMEAAAEPGERLRNRDDADTGEPFDPDEGAYGFFSGDVKA